MRKLLLLAALSGCSSYPQVNWPAGSPGQAPALLPMAEVLGPDGSVTDAAGAALAAQAAALKARVAKAR